MACKVVEIKLQVRYPDPKPAEFVEARICNIHQMISFAYPENKEGITLPEGALSIQYIIGKDSVMIFSNRCDLD